MEKKLLNFLKELKKYGIENDIPNVTEVGGRFLNMLIKMTQAKQVLEIGCANGYSTIWMAEAVRKNGGKVSTIDFSKPTFEAAKKNLAKAGLSDYVNFYFGNALEVILDIEEPEQFDFIFVDGEKKSYWDFWEAIQDRLAINAVIIFDDVLSFFMHCHHLRDWLSNDPDTPFTKDQVLTFVRETPVLAVVADICNGTKHMFRTRKPASGADPRVATQDMIMELGPGLKRGEPDFRVRIMIGIQHGEKILDAFKLATEAMDAWRDFMERQPRQAPREGRKAENGRSQVP